MFSKPALFGILLVFGLATGELIEIDDSQLNKDHRRENDTTTDAPFGEPDFGPEDGGLEILGPKNPDKPGDMIGNDIDIETDKGKGNKVTEDPWKPLSDPDNKNAFGQTFPAPENVPQVPKRPGHNFPDPETESPFSGHGQNNEGFGNEPESPTQGHHLPNHGGFDHYPTNRPTHGTFEPYPTDAPSVGGHHVPNHGSFEPYPTNRPIHGTFEPYPTDAPIHGTFEPYPDESNEHHWPQNGGERPHYPYYTQKPHYYPEPTTENYEADKDEHFPHFGGILGWGKQTTKTPEKWGHSGGILGGILGGWKDKHQKNKEAIDKAANSVKEAGEKVVGAGKDILEAGWEIGGNLLSPLKHGNNGGKSHSLFPHFG